MALFDADDLTEMFDTGEMAVEAYYTQNGKTTAKKIIIMFPYEEQTDVTVLDSYDEDDINPKLKALAISAAVSSITQSDSLKIDNTAYEITKYKNNRNGTTVLYLIEQ